jgi:ribosomal protein S18 acetylase RimI-like enzyme
VKIRVLDENDLDSVVEIDKRVLGKERRSFWKRKMAYAGIYPRPALVAEVNKKIVGFILGFVSGWEFGVPDTVGWIDTIGVDPDFQRRGIGRALFNALMDIFAKSGSQRTLETKEQEVEGVNIVYTLASWTDWDLLQFYHAMGLKKGEMLSLEMKMR